LVLACTVSEILRDIIAANSQLQLRAAEASRGLSKNCEAVKYMHGVAARCHNRASIDMRGLEKNGKYLAF